jgi:hypothetical protein
MSFASIESAARGVFALDDCGSETSRTARRFAIENP